MLHFHPACAQHSQQHVMDWKLRGEVLYLQQKHYTAAVSIRDIRHREMRPEVQAAMCTVSTKCNLESMFFFFQRRTEKPFLPPRSSNPLVKLIQSILAICRLALKIFTTATRTY